jgi:hypothetical protein
MLDILRTAPQESVERRVERILERLAQGGEIAQSVVRELFPDGLWLYPDPEGGRFLWAAAQTAMLYPAGLVDADGRSLAEGFPRVYNAITTVEAAEPVVGNSMVAGAGFSTHRLSLAA